MFMGNQIKVTYVLWVGVVLSIDEPPFPNTPGLLGLGGSKFLDEIKRKKLDFSIIDSDSLGVIIEKTEWENKIGKKNRFNLNNLSKAERVCKRINKIFAEFNISLDAKIYHHTEIELI